MKYITFLGLGPKDGYKELITFFENDAENISCTKLVQHHIYENYKDQIDQVYVFTTKESHERYFDEFCQIIPESIINEIQIDQNITSELFVDHLINILDDSDDVILDVTHSFRKIPIRLLFALRYVEAMKNVRIRSVFYGEVEKQNTEQSFSIVHDLAKDYQMQKVTEYLSQFDRTLIIRREDWKELSLGDQTIENLMDALAQFNEMTEFCNLDAAASTVLQISEKAKAIVNKRDKASGENPYILLTPLAKQIQEKFAKVSRNNSETQNLVEIICVLLQHERFQLAITFTDELFGRELIRNTVDPNARRFDAGQIIKQIHFYGSKRDKEKFPYNATQYLKEKTGLRKDAHIWENLYQRFEDCFEPYGDNIQRLQSIVTIPGNEEVIHHFSTDCRNVVNHASTSSKTRNLKTDIEKTVLKMLNIIQQFDQIIKM
ncbi:CRISPR-associated DxTHG motif protein [Allobaculum sp. JKK-2023]|uniref:CRISPR-associated DxTHG motif protein n=1 Tax=Allobaculum sp. JKK-2023 TaxID=3108943 RepID=UPI002B053DF6|nr:TM1812 family CRISPR-associated protein [Allobaculum sp. JKK-2023]